MEWFPYIDYNEGWYGEKNGNKTDWWKMETYDVWSHNWIEGAVAEIDAYILQ